MPRQGQQEGICPLSPATSLVALLGLSQHSTAVAASELAWAAAARSCRAGRVHTLRGSWLQAALNSPLAVTPHPRHSGCPPAPRKSPFTPFYGQSPTVALFAHCLDPCFPVGIISGGYLSSWVQMTNPGHTPVTGEVTMHGTACFPPCTEGRVCPVWPCFTWTLAKTSLAPTSETLPMLLLVNPRAQALSGAGKTQEPSPARSRVSGGLPRLSFPGCRPQELTGSILQGLVFKAPVDLG